jgi:hypothetical protein
LILVVALIVGILSLSTPLLTRSEVSETAQGIEAYRKGTVQLRLVDAAGKGLPNYAFSIAQISHDFLFAAHPMGEANKYDPRYADLLQQAGINFSYGVMTWGSGEQALGQFTWEEGDSYEGLSVQLERGFGVMGGGALWFYRSDALGDQFCPLYLDELNFDQLKTATYNHLYSLASTYRGSIDIWEFGEQNAEWTNPLKLTWRQKLDLIKVGISALRDANPAAQILFCAPALPDEFGWPVSVNLADEATGVQFPTFLRMLIDEGIPVDIVGLVLFYSGRNAHGNAPPTLSIDALAGLIDTYSSFGKPVFIRDLSAPSEQVEGTSLWNGRPWSEDVQAEYVREFYTMAFSKPLVKEIGWSVGVSDEDSFVISGGLLDKDLNPKKSYYALKGLIDSWTTSGDYVTDENGEAALRGFAGDYVLTITAPSGYKLQSKFHISEQQQSQVTVNAFPSPPSDLVATTVSSSQTDLAWTDNADNEDGFELERRIGTEPYENLVTAAANTTSYSDTGLHPNTTYSYRLRAHSPLADSSYSNEATVTTQKEPPPPRRTVIRVFIDKTSYYIDDKRLEMDVAPMIIGSRTLLPIRWIAEPLGALVTWSESEKKVSIAHAGKMIELWIGNCIARVDGIDQRIDPANAQVVAVIVRGRTLLPVRFIAETLGCSVDWDAATRGVTIMYEYP